MENLNVKISDFGLGTSLLALGFKIDYLDRTDPKRVNFVFLEEDKTKLLEAIRSFYRGELKIEPRLFVYHQKELKQRIYNQAE